MSSEHGRAPARAPETDTRTSAPAQRSRPGWARKLPTGRRAPEATRSNALHAGAWWLWALGLATAASRTTNPLLLGLIVAVAGYVVAVRRTDAPWARSYRAFLLLGLSVVVIRLVFSVILGSPIPGSTTLVTLPEVPLPDWARGVRIGGRVTLESLVFAFYDGVKLAALLACLGAANALANPARLLKSLPGALYEVGVAVVVAMTFAPNLVADVVRLRAARRLRGRPDKGIKAVLQIGLPVLEGALERSVALAATMDARGYGRTAQVPPAVRHTTTALTLGGLLGVCAGTYGLLAAEGAGFGLPLLLVGVAAALAGLRLGGRRSVRSRYRPDVWGARAWLVSGSGAAVAALMIGCAAQDPAALHPSVVPLAAPSLPLWPAAAVLLGLLPAFVAPAPPFPGASGRPGVRPSAAASGGTPGVSPERPRRTSSLFRPSHPSSSPEEEKP
ncbi:CbiQ family ECF transporter T component [Streptomyces sp. bgisy100]|uniref:CbiQ family ECF transporter T component n=1 Tax=Streptomyces sp. bgisy100 TaxID=3413783 RepID=UPI003D71B8D8